MMIITKDIAEVRECCQKLQHRGAKIGFVPTMGALHAGHLSLVKLSKEKTDITVVSIFLNPTQFAPGEDLASYPVNLKGDLRQLKEAGVDLVFTPDKETMYLPNADTTVSVGGVTSVLCGSSRPTHFQGVTTVVAKLFNIVTPDFSFFGEKDYQQVVVIKKMVDELNFNTEIVTGEIVREEDGLAMSSRNSYLTKLERAEAVVLSECIMAGKQMAEDGSSPEDIISYIRKRISSLKTAKIDYIEIVSRDSLQTVDDFAKDAVLLLAVYFGNTRLIDNCEL